jgi:aryl-alcohol dehydrogenase-like predicted oxidoreductase
MNGPHELSRLATRREALELAAGFGMVAVAAPLMAAAAAEPGAAIVRRPIPSTGELLPAVGLGTAHEFGRGDDAAHRAESVVRTLVAGGGSVIDTASTYGPSETALGTVLAETGLRPRVFIATKLEEDQLSDAELRQGSLRRLQTERIDLMQLHNVSRTTQSLAPLREWKARGLVRYIGITTSEDGEFPTVEAVLRREKPDFIQINYWLTDREAEKRLLPAAAELGVGVLINMPFGDGSLFRAVRGKALPEWASDFGAASWGQFFLKYLLADPAVTVVIPETSNPDHMNDNLAAGHGPLPDTAMRQRMVQLIQSFG